MPQAATAATRSPHAARLRRLARSLADLGASHFLVTDPADVGYLTGFLGGDSYLIVPASGKPTILTDFRYEEELSAYGRLVRVHVRTRGMLPALADLVAGADALAFQAEHLTVAQRNGLAKAIGARRLVPTEGVLADLRTIKDAEEVSLIRKAIRIQEQALQALLPTLEPGRTELEIAGLLELEMKRRGASGTSFDTIVAAGAHGSHPHYRPAKARTARNRPLLIDWGARYRGYGGDMTRTFTFGRWPAALGEAYRVVLDAHLLAADALRDGALSSEIDRIARDHITSHLDEGCYRHGLGHGLGINVHEAPRLSQASDAVPLRAGMVVTIEPAVYLPGVGGIRLEDDYLITSRGARNLCSLPKDPRWAVL